MSFLINSAKETMGSAISLIWDYGKWMFGNGDGKEALDAVVPSATPLVFTRKSSLFIDEDGDTAHEFYEEIAPTNGKPWMKRITENLIEQGLVKLRYPRLHVDFPVAMYEG